MNIAVCVKQVPSADSPARLDPVTKNLDRSGLFALDESDSYSVEMALQLVEAAADGGEVTVVSMVPRGEMVGVRTALAMGAARAIVVSDEALAGSDALSTAKVLAAAISRLGVDLALFATESTDGYTGTVPAQVAELMGQPVVSFAKHVELSDGMVRVARQTEEGYDEVVCPIPAVVSVTAGVVEPRFPSFRGIMSARSKPVERLSLADLGIDPSKVGRQGARQEVVAVEAAESRAGGEIVTDDGEVEVRIVAQLEEWKVL